MNRIVLETLETLETSDELDLLARTSRSFERPQRVRFQARSPVRPEQRHRQAGALRALCFTGHGKESLTFQTLFRPRGSLKHATIPLKHESNPYVNSSNPLWPSIDPIWP